MATKKEQIGLYKTKIATNRFWAARACLAIYACQTASEQMVGETKEENGVGFNGRDAEWGTKMALALKSRGFTKDSDHVPLSKKEMGILFRMMPKYAGQLVRMQPAQPAPAPQYEEEPEAVMDGEEYRDMEERFAIAEAHNRVW